MFLQAKYRGNQMWSSFNSSLLWYVGFDYFRFSALIDLLYYASKPQIRQMCYLFFFYVHDYATKCKIFRVYK